jgi:two-component system cell cycle response regulator CpdR
METIMAHILIAEDDESVRTFLEMAMMMEGHEVQVAYDGANALEILHENNGQFDLLISDIQMPIMDGIKLAHMTAEQFPHLTILMMTGYAHQRERAGRMEQIVHEVVPKPFSLADIRQHVSEALLIAA